MLVLLLLKEGSDVLVPKVAHLEDELTFRDEQLLDLEQRFRQLMVISEKDAKVGSTLTHHVS